MSTSRAPEGETAGDLAAAVRVLTREVEQLRVGVAELTKKSDRTEGTANAAARAVTTINDAVTGLYEQQQGHDHGPEGDDGDGVPSKPWWRVSGQDEARAMLDDLTEWVSDVYTRYSVGGRDLPGCWPLHPDAVAELLALREGWETAYYGKFASTSAVMDWHDRWRPGAAKRVAAAIGNCRLESHADGKKWQQPARPGAELVDDVASWWADSQGSTTPPSPSRDALRMEKERRKEQSQAAY